MFSRLSLRKPSLLRNGSTKARRSFTEPSGSFARRPTWVATLWRSAMVSSEGGAQADLRISFRTHILQRTARRKQRQVIERPANFDHSSLTPPARWVDERCHDSDIYFGFRRATFNCKYCSSMLCVTYWPTAHSVTGAAVYRRLKRSLYSV